MTLVAMPAKCLDIPHPENNHQNLVIWKFEPNQGIIYRDKKEIQARADASGLWHPGANVDGRVCRR